MSDNDMIQLESSDDNKDNNIVPLESSDDNKDNNIVPLESSDDNKDNNIVPLESPDDNKDIQPESSLPKKQEKEFSPCSIRFYLLFFTIYGSFCFGSFMVAANYLSISCGNNMVLQLPQFFNCHYVTPIFLSLLLCIFFSMVLMEIKNKLIMKIAASIILFFAFVCNLISLIFTILSGTELKFNFHQCIGVMPGVIVLLIINMIIIYVSIAMSYNFFLHASEVIF